MVSSHTSMVGRCDFIHHWLEAPRASGTSYSNLSGRGPGEGICRGDNLTVVLQSVPQEQPPQRKDAATRCHRVWGRLGLPGREEGVARVNSDPWGPVEQQQLSRGDLSPGGRQ